MANYLMQYCNYTTCLQNIYTHKPHLHFHFNIYDIVCDQFEN